MAKFTPGQLAKMKKDFEAETKESTSILEKATAISKQAEVLKATAKKAKAELSQETD
jgi:hypothetical protein